MNNNSGVETERNNGELTQENILNVGVGVRTLYIDILQSVAVCTVHHGHADRIDTDSAFFLIVKDMKQKVKFEFCAAK